MRQRVMIAMAVACQPKVLVADEPTTALDVTVQAGILDVLRDLRDRLGTSILIITHDLGVIADVADRVVVMYAGRVVERAGVDELFARPQHHYTAGLLSASPAPGRHAGRDRLQEIPGLVPVLCSQPDACTFADRCPAADAQCLSAAPPLARGALPRGVPARPRRADHLVACWHPVGVPGTDVGEAAATRGAGEPPMSDTTTPAADGRGRGPRAGGPRHALRRRPRRRRGVAAAAPGQVMALVGESGSGKSTVGRCIVRLLEPTAGTVRLDGADVTHLSRRQMRRHSRDVSIVFQDPAGSLDPRMLVGDVVAEPLRLQPGRLSRRDLQARVAEELGRVGLRAEVARRYPHELSGGQRQRVSIARALVSSPRLLVADEPTSALDVSVQASVLNLLADLQRDMGSPACSSPTTCRRWSTSPTTSR